MINCFIAAAYMTVCAVTALCIIYKKYLSIYSGRTGNPYKRKIIYFSGTLLLFVVYGIVVCIYINQRGDTAVPAVLKWITLLWGCYILSITDLKERRIPNRIIVGLLAIRFIFLLYELIKNYDFTWEIIYGTAMGAAVGFLVMMAGRMVSRKSVGMGDVKLFMIMGAYTGNNEIFIVMFYTFVLSAITGVILLAARKIHIKDSVPMAPFAFLGAGIEFMFLMAGG